MVRLKPLELIFGAFLLIVFVRTMPFTARVGLDPAALELEVGGNIARQLLYVGFFLLILIVARRQAMTLLRAAPVPLLLLVGWAVLSLAWSAVPEIAGRRLVATMLVGAAMLIVGVALKPGRTIAILRGTTLLLAAATIVAGVLLPALAIHQPGDPEPTITGAWRGVFFHKNMAGSVIGLGVVLAVDRWLAVPRRPGAIATVLVTVVALVLTQSKGSAAAAAVSLLALLAFRGAARLSRGDPAGGLALRASAAGAAAAALIVAWSATNLSDYLLDPEAFTGRGRLWQAVWQLIEQRPMLGWGYASVFQVGERGPLSPVATSEWVRRVSQSHNGLLDLWVTMGAVGAALAVWALFLDPWVRIARLPPAVRDEWQPLIAAVLAFALVQGLVEGGLMVASGVKWATLTLVVGVSLRLAGATPPAGPARS